MGTSVVFFGPHGFWLNDGHFQLLLHFLANEVDRLPDPPDWLQDKRDAWREESASAKVGCFSACLQDIGPSEKALRIAGLADKIYGRVLAGTESLEREKASGGDTFVGDAPKEWFLQGLEAFIRLLESRLQVTPEKFPVLPIIPIFDRWRPGDPELSRINQLWIALESAHFSVLPGHSILNRVLTRMWESPDPPTQLAWQAIVKAENLRSLERWKAESPLGFSTPLRKNPQQGLSADDAVEEALRQCKANQP